MSERFVYAKDLGKVFTRKGSPPIEVLKHVNFEITPTDLIAIVGKSGAGKSTLLHCLGTLERPTSGNVYFLGQDVFAYGEEQLSQFRNQKIGFVFQLHYLMLEFTALENVMIPALLGGVRKSNAERKARDFLVRVGLEHRLDHKPGQLSGGEQQRVAIARALMQEPRLLLTDEMTGNLDPVTGSHVFELLMSLHSEFKMAIVSVTHDLNLAKYYKKRMQLENGVLTAV